MRVDRSAFGLLAVLCWCPFVLAAEVPVHSDDFSGSGLGELHPFWQPRGSTVVLGSPPGWVSLQQNVTDDYVQIDSVGLQPMRSVRVRMTHRMLPGSSNFFPSLYFMLSTGEHPGFRWLRSNYGPDYCNSPGGYDKVLVRVTEGCVISGISSSSLYGKVIESEVFADFQEGIIKYDLGADGTVDFEARFPGRPGVTIDRIEISGYGWYTGHRHEVDSITISGEHANIGPGLTWTPESIDFGAQVLGTESSAKRIVFSNTGDAAVSLGDPKLSGVDAQDFRVATDSCRRTTLGPGQTCHVDLTMRPSQLAPRTAWFQLPHAGGAGQAEVALTGTGVADAAVPVPVAVSLSRTSGAAGTTTTVYGRSFGSSQADGYVIFSQGSKRIPAKVESWRDSSIRVVVPQLNGGVSSVSVSTRGGTSQALSFDSLAYCPLQINPSFPAARAEPQLFGPIWSPNANAPKNAFAPLAAAELNRSIGGGAVLSDDCYLGAMDAMRIASNKNFVMLGINSVAANVVQASIGTIPADTPFANLLLKISSDVVNKVFLGDPLGDSLVRTITKESAGLILAKAAGDVYLKGLVPPIVDLTFDQIKFVLDEDKVFSWTLAGSNVGTKYGDLVPPTSIDAMLWYNAWSGYTSALVRATCEVAGSVLKKTFLVSYENAKDSSWNATGQISTLAAKELRSDGDNCQTKRARK